MINEVTAFQSQQSSLSKRYESVSTTMAKLKPKSFVTAICIALMGILGVVQLALVARVIAWTSSDSTLNGETNIKMPSVRHELFHNDISIGLLPEMLTKTGASIMFWTGCGSVVDALLLSGLLVGLLKSYRNQRLLNIVYAVICAVVIIRPLVVLIYVFVEYRGAAKELELPFSGLGTQNRASEFTPESWTCTLQRYISDSDIGTRRTIRGICDQSLTARYLLIPIFLVSLLVVACIYWQRKGLEVRNRSTPTTSLKQGLKTENGYADAELHEQRMQTNNVSTI